jgi:tRNA threonylcarbamoyladenosine biosynthesis protein TsaB
MKILALELSSSVGSVAFSGGEAEVEFRAFPADRKDSGFFFENLRALYEKSGPAEMIVVGLGPGSYAGTRIAIATALGLGVAAGARLCGLPSICAIERKEYFFVGDARRNSFVFAHVSDGHCLEGPTLATAEEVRARLAEERSFPAIASQPLPQFENLILEHPSALRLAALARRGEGEGSDTLEPIYLRSPYITVPVK